ncbi:MAG: sulfate ABC transporter substrate-binding protein [Synechococcaceae cyanobacterium]|nr:sulfate ABC transporter substrate-binding protein [Synechococcaceae cyanobacterium]
MLSRSALSVLLAPLLAGLLVTGCGGGRESSSSSGNGKDLLLVSYAVTKSAYDKILPKFEADWKARTGQSIRVRTSYGGSGSQTRAILDGLEADVATLALAGDVLKLQKAGLVQPGWEKELPHEAIITNSVVAFLTRDGNPRQIRDWSDLARKDVKVITANPKTSGGARWNFLGLWGSVTQAGGSEAQARAYVSSVYRNVENLPKDAREATDAFLKRGQGDVLLNYENEAILARQLGELKQPFIVPQRNIRIEGPVAVVDRNVDQRGTRKAAEALAAYLQAPEAQRIFAEQGFRPVNPQVWSEVKDRFAPVAQPFTVAAFGGWDAVDARFFGKRGGLWDELFGQSRR